MMRSMNLISPRMELNQYHLLTKKVLFRLSYRGTLCAMCAMDFLGPMTACVCFTQRAFLTMCAFFTL